MKESYRNLLRASGLAWSHMGVTCVLANVPSGAISIMLRAGLLCALGDSAQRAEFGIALAASGSTIVAGDRG